MQTMPQRLPTFFSQTALLTERIATSTNPRPHAENSLTIVMVGDEKVVEHSTGSILLDSLQSEEDSLTPLLLLQQLSSGGSPYFEQLEPLAFYFCLEKADLNKSEAVPTALIVQAVDENEPDQDRSSLTHSAEIANPINVADQQPLGKPTSVSKTQTSVAIADREKEPDLNQDNSRQLTERSIEANEQPVEPKIVQKTGLQLSTFDMNHGLVDVEDPLLFSSAKNRQDSLSPETDTVVFDYLTRQLESFTLPESTPSSLRSNCLRTTYLKPTEAGVHIVQDKVVLSVSNLILEDATEISDSQPGAANSSSTASEQNRRNQQNQSMAAGNQSELEQSRKYNASVIDCLSDRIDLLAAAVDCLNQGIIELQEKQNKHKGIVSSV